jgi:hypothetical protein
MTTPFNLDLTHFKSLQIDFDCRSNYEDRLEPCIYIIYIYILGASAASGACPQNHVYVHFMLLFVVV